MRTVPLSTGEAEARIGNVVMMKAMASVGIVCASPAEKRQRLTRDVLQLSASAIARLTWQVRAMVLAARLKVDL